MVELFVTVVIIGILLAVSAMAIGRAQRAKSQTVCAVNLRSISQAFQSYMMDNGGRYPQPSTAAQWEDLLRTYVHRLTFRCPGDQELFPAVGSSYDWRDTADPDCSLAGRMYTEVGRANISLSYDALPGWHVPGKLQVVKIDGSVRLLADEPFLFELQTPVTSGP